jgi:hypothetical protein
MRILQSVEIDEENLDYIKEKQKNQQKLKSRFESIFEKFGNMNESQSDEIDMKTNRVVVDRGHLRRIKRQLNGKEKTLLDTIVLSAGRNPKGEEGEASEEDSEDELAPPQPVKSRTTVPSEDLGKPRIEATEINTQQPTSHQSGFPAQPIPQLGVPQISNTPNPAADLLRNVQLPQTPAGHEAQSAAFYANLLQTINQAVHHFTAGLNTPNAPTSFPNAVPTPITPITTNDKVAPATDPKWFFPPLSAKPHQCPIAQSSPLPSHTVASATEEGGQQHKDTILIEVAEESPMTTLYTRPGESSPTRPRRSSPRVEIQRRIPRPARMYHFTHEDDLYISKRKRTDGVSWSAIKDGREKWKMWPMSALHNRWVKIKDQNLHLQEPLVAPTSGRVNASDFVSTEEGDAVSKPPHHLPTPSSSEHEECHQGPMQLTEESGQDMLSSSTHYDDDDRDLLSLAGSDPDEDQPSAGDDDTIEVASRHVILPSIETRDLVNQDTILEHLPATPQTEDFILTPTRASSIAIKSEPAFSSPTALLKRKQSPPIAEVIPNSQQNEDDIQDDFSNIIVAPYESAESAAHYEYQQQSTHATAHRRSPSLSLIDTSTGDELLPFPSSATYPTTPSLKRARVSESETNTPPSISLSASRSYQTPKARDMDGSSETGTIKSTSKTGRKAFLKRVKREWTRRATPAKEKESVGKSGGKRMSLGGGLGGLEPGKEERKRKWVDYDDSEDELTIR